MMLILLLISKFGYVAIGIGIGVVLGAVATLCILYYQRKATIKSDRQIDVESELIEEFLKSKRRGRDVYQYELEIPEKNIKYYEHGTLLSAPDYDTKPASLSRNETLEVEPYKQTSSPKREIDCSIFAPTRTSAGQTILVQVFMHLNDVGQQAANFAKLVDETASFRNTSVLTKHLKKGSTLGVYLKMPGLIIDEPQQSIVWQDATNSVQFGVDIPANHPLKNVIGTVYVSYENVPIGHMKFTLGIVSDDAMKEYPDGRTKTISSWKTYKNAFISYASPDRPEVLKRVQMLKVAKIDFFQDLQGVEPSNKTPIKSVLLES